MANFHCPTCEKNIDLDFDVEHYKYCPETPDIDDAVNDLVATDPEVKS
jgi:hypothetical protein